MRRRHTGARRLPAERGWGPGNRRYRRSRRRPRSPWRPAATAGPRPADRRAPGHGDRRPRPCGRRDCAGLRPPAGSARPPHPVCRPSSASPGPVADASGPGPASSCPTPRPAPAKRPRHCAAARPPAARQTQARPCCPLRKKWAAPSTKASEAPARAARPFHLPGWGHARGAASICMLPSILPSCLFGRLPRGRPACCPPLSRPQWSHQREQANLATAPASGLCSQPHERVRSAFQKNMWDGMMTKYLAQLRAACSIPQNGTEVWYLHAKWGRTGSPAGLSPSVN